VEGTQDVPPEARACKLTKFGENFISRKDLVMAAESELGPISEDGLGNDYAKGEEVIKGVRRRKKIAYCSLFVQSDGKDQTASFGARSTH